MTSAIDDWADKRTIGQVLNDSAAKFGHRDAWVFGDQRITFRELRQQVDRFAGGLLRLGIRNGDKVSIWMPNCLEWLYAYLAVAKIGGVLVPVNTRFKAQEAEYLVGQSDSTTLIIADKFLNVDFVGLVAELCPELAHATPGRLDAKRLPALRNLICVSPSRFDGMYSYAEVMALGNNFPPSELQAVEEAVDPEAMVLMIYTSGSTGFPKGVMHSHKVLRNVADVAERLSLTEADCNLLYMPLFHGYGAVITTLGFLLTGGRVVLMDHFDVADTLRLIEAERVSILFGLETTLHDQMTHPDFARRDLSSLRTGICPTGTASEADLVKAVIAKMCKVRGCFGMTELTGASALSLESDSPKVIASTSGFPLPGQQLKIVDPSTGATLPPNTPGELCGKGHPLMLGYYKKPEETARSIDGEGWFHTGDLALLTDRGYLRFIGRIKDIFRVGGENADPAEVEALLLRHPAVSTCQVTGVPDKRLGEVGMAFVQFRVGQGAIEQELIDFCKGKIANFKVPRYVMEVAEYPLTPIGKIHKAKLREMAVRKLGLEG